MITKDYGRVAVRIGALLLFVLSLIPVPHAAAQASTATLSGQVRDESGGTLPDVQVIVVNGSTGLQRQTSSDTDGRFVLPMLPAGRYVVTAQLQGFAPAQIKDLVLNANDQASIMLELKIAPLNEMVSVQVDAGRVTPAPSRIDVSPLEVRSVAGATENIYRVLQTLPGVVGVSDFDSRLTVRGGGPDQNLTMMDGVEIHNPYRLFGLTSAFNPETVQNFELTAGGFNAKYGDRLSSILIIENRDGTDQRNFTGSAAMAFTDANIVTEGKLPGASNGSWLLTGRRTHYDLIAEPLVDTNLPGFTDVQGKGVWSPRPGHRLTLFGLSSRESTDAEFDEDNGELIKLKSSTHNDVGAMSYQATFGTHATNKTTVSWYRNREEMNFDGNLRGPGRRSNRPGDEAEVFSNTIFTRKIAVRDVAVRNELTITPSPNHVIETGFESHALRTGWGWDIRGDRNLDEANGSSAFGGAGLPALLDSSRSTSRVGAWLTDRWKLLPKLTVEPGLRLDWSGLASEVVASPRLALVADLDDKMRLRVAGGLFTQSPGYEKLLQSDYFLDLSNAESLGLRSERAWHALVGLERTIGPGLVARVEGYYKDFSRLIVGRLETPEALAARLETYDFPIDLRDQLPRSPIVTSVPGNDGTGRAYGVEFYVARQALSSTDRISGWLSYTWGKAEQTSYGQTYLADYDRPHALSLVANYRLSRLLELGTTVRIQSGFPYTTPLGVRVAATEDRNDADGDGNLTELIPQRDAEGYPVWTAEYGDVTNLNSGRLPIFARVDMRLTFRPRWHNNRWQLYMEVINVLNRKNAGVLETELVYDPTSDRPRLTTKPDAALPLLPTFGVRIRF